MTHYIHHVPGRLRVKTSAIKGNEAYAVQTQEYLRALHGVVIAEVRPVTGSVVVHYDPARVDPRTILHSLASLGCIRHAQAGPDHQVGVIASIQAGHSLTDTVLTKVLNKVVETILERSAVALVAALI
jgi:hypothetical protein